MGANVTIDTSGIDKLLEQLDPRGKQLIRTTAEGIRGDAMQLAPVDTGALKNSNYVDPLDNGWTAMIGFSVEYAIYQELGTRKMRAHPFLIPAFEKWRQPFLDAWKEIFP